MTAFLFSDVSTWGFETMFTRFSEASVLRSVKNRPVSNVKAVSPAARGPNAPAGGRIDDGAVSVPPGWSVALPMLNRPWRTAQSMPKLRSSVSVISATSTSISTWRGILSSCLIVLSISCQSRG